METNPSLFMSAPGNCMRFLDKKLDEPISHLLDFVPVEI